MKVAFYTATLPGLQGLYSRLIRWIDHGPYSHCELLFSDGLNASASYVDHGVRFKKFVFDLAKWDVIEIDADEASARAWFESHEGATYDVIGVARFIFGFLHQNPSRWFCSEAIAAALGMPDAWRYGPSDLYSALTKSPFQSAALDSPVSPTSALAAQPTKTDMNSSTKPLAIVGLHNPTTDPDTDAPITFFVLSQYTIQLRGGNSQAILQGFTSQNSFDVGKRPLAHVAVDVAGVPTGDTTQWLYAAVLAKPDGPMANSVAVYEPEAAAKTPV